MTSSSFFKRDRILLNISTLLSSIYMSMFATWRFVSVREDAEYADLSFAKCGGDIAQ